MDGDTAPVTVSATVPTPAPVSSPVVAAASKTVVTSPPAAVTAAKTVVAAEAPQPVPQSTAAPAAAPAVAAAPVVEMDSAAEAMLKRAARFGIQPVAAVVEKVEKGKLASRAERFGIEVAPQGAAAATAVAGQGQGKQQKNKKQAAPAVVDPELAAKLAKRAERFGVISPVLQKVVQTQSKLEEVRVSVSSSYCSESRVNMIVVILNYFYVLYMKKSVTSLFDWIRTD